MKRYDSVVWRSVSLFTTPKALGGGYSTAEGREGRGRDAGGPRPQDRGTRGAGAGAARRIKGRALAPPEVAGEFSAP